VYVHVRQSIGLAKQVAKAIWYKAVSPTHMDSSVVFARWHQCEPPFDTCFLGPTRVSSSISIGSAVFAGLTTVTERQTDRARYSVCNSRPACTYVVLWCGLKMRAIGHCGNLWVKKVPFILRGSVGTRVTCKFFVGSLLMTVEFYGERMSKIGQNLAKLRTERV